MFVVTRFFIHAGYINTLLKLEKVFAAKCIKIQPPRRIAVAVYGKPNAILLLHFRCAPVETFPIGPRTCRKILSRSFAPSGKRSVKIHPKVEPDPIVAGKT